MRSLRTLDMSNALFEGLWQKIELEATADLLYGVGTPERAAFEARFAELREKDLGELVDLLEQEEDEA